MTREEEILKEWKNKSIPNFDGKEEFINYLTNIFISSQMKAKFTDNIQTYVETRFNNQERKWARAIKLIKDNYSYFRMIGWTENDYNSCLSICIAKYEMISRANLIKIYNDYKLGIYDDLFDSTDDLWD